MSPLVSNDALIWRSFNPRTAQWLNVTQSFCGLPGWPAPSLRPLHHACWDLDGLLQSTPCLILLFLIVVDLKRVNSCCVAKWLHIVYPYLYFLLFLVCLLYYIYILFHILFHFGLSQDSEYSSLCYTVGPCHFSSCGLVCITSSFLGLGCWPHRLPQCSPSPLPSNLCPRSPKERVLLQSHFAPILQPPSHPFSSLSILVCLVSPHNPSSPGWTLDHLARKEAMFQNMCGPLAAEWKPSAGQNQMLLSPPVTPSYRGEPVIPITPSYGGEPGRQRMVVRPPAELDPTKDSLTNCAWLCFVPGSTLIS